MEREIRLEFSMDIVLPCEVCCFVGRWMIVDAKFEVFLAVNQNDDFNICLN